MSIFSVIARGIGGFVTGGPAGAAAAVLGPAIIGKQRRAVQSSFSGLPQGADSIITSTTIGGPYGYSKTIKQYPGNVDGGGRPGQGTALVPMAQACAVGYKLNKSTYVTRGGGTSHWPMQLMVHEKHSTCVKRRRRNVGNAKALRRAISRVKGFVKLARKAHSLVGPHHARKQLSGGRAVEVIRAG